MPISKIVIFIFLVVSGFLLSTLGLISFPVFHNINYFWPAAVIQAVGAVLFGWTGVIAGTIFPMFSNFATDKSLVSVFVFTPSNFIQSYLPYLLCNKFANPTLNFSSRRGKLRFVLYAAIIPQLCGGLLASSILYALGHINGTDEFLKMVILWFIDSVPWIILCGIPIVTIFVPLLKDYGYLYGLDIRSKV